MANITTQTIRVDLSTGKVIPTAYTHQNDTARTLVFDMYNDGLPYTMTGNTVKFAYKSPVVNGQYSVITGSGMASGTVSGNKVSVTLPVAYTQISGVGMLTMVITPTSGTVRPVNIRLVVQKSADGANEIAGASDFPTTLEGIAEDWLEDNISIQIDPTLSVSGKAADAKVTGDEINDLKSDLDTLNDGGLVLKDEVIGEHVEDWLDDHPEATTTVQDGSITIAKFSASVVDDSLSEEGHPADAKAVGEKTKYWIANQYNLEDTPNAFLKKSFAWLTDTDNLLYGQQGATVTDEYIVLAGNCVTSGSENTRFYIYVLDKTTYEPVTLSNGNPQFFVVADHNDWPATFHANNVSWVEEDGEIYIGNGGTYRHTLVFDADTMAYKRVDMMPGTGQIAFDNVNSQWAKVTNANGYLIIEIFDKQLNLLKTINDVKKVGTMQGLMFNDGLLYIPTSMDSTYTSVDGFTDAENILVVDTNGNVVRSWWFPNTSTELEDMGLIDDSHMLIATNASGRLVNLYEMPFKIEKDISKLTADDSFGKSKFIDDTAYPREITVTLPTQSDFTVNSVRCFKYEGFAFVKLEGTALSALSNWVTIATGLPNPTGTILAVNLITNNGRATVRARVNTGGNLQIAIPRFEEGYNGNIGTQFGYICE